MCKSNLQPRGNIPIFEPIGKMHAVCNGDIIVSEFYQPLMFQCQEMMWNAKKPHIFMFLQMDLILQ